jgi:hypothetical protein
VVEGDVMRESGLSALHRLCICTPASFVTNKRVLSSEKLTRHIAMALDVYTYCTCTCGFWSSGAYIALRAVTPTGGDAEACANDKGRRHSMAGTRLLVSYKFLLQGVSRGRTISLLCTRSRALHSSLPLLCCVGRIFRMTGSHALAVQP